MSILELLGPYRDKYVTFYRDCVVKWRNEHRDCVPEVMVQPNGAENPAPYSLLRIDAVYGGAAKPAAVRFAMDPEIVDTAALLDFAGTPIAVQRVSWEGLRVSFRSRDFRMQSLHSWLSSWIDENDKRPVDQIGLAGVVHSIAWNSTPAGDWEITVDFGSAPVAAFGELLYLLLESGAKTIVLDGPNEPPPQKTGLH
jgi:hypothetical protein